MAINNSKFVLVEKKQLTHDVWELVFSKQGDAIETKPWQYILFILASGKRRAYSISYSEGNTYCFIIKRLFHEWAGSSELCDLNIGESVAGMGPIGHFILSDWDISRAFIGTGTGFAPLYFQVKALESRNFSENTHFVFWVRNNEDIFYQDEFQRLSRENPNFSFTQFLSKGEPSNWEYKGYVGDILTEDFVSKYQEYYLCGSPAMVKEVREKLAIFGVEGSRIRFEQF